MHFKTQPPTGCWTSYAHVRPSLVPTQEAEVIYPPLLLMDRDARMQGSQRRRAVLSRDCGLCVCE
mgnify:CR=1 FL=1